MARNRETVSWVPHTHLRMLKEANYTALEMLCLRTQELGKQGLQSTPATLGGAREPGLLGLLEPGLCLKVLVLYGLSMISVVSSGMDLHCL